MTVTGFVVWFIVMAAATMTILVVGTLGAADLLHRRHNTAGGRPDGSSIERRPERAKARRDAHLEAPSHEDSRQGRAA
jgi:hypothetical protein